MGQISKRELSSKVKRQLQEALWQAIIRVTTSNDAEQFINDLLTETEKVMLAKRLAIALLLEKGYEYRTIRDVLKVSTGTIMMVGDRLRREGWGFRQVSQKLERDRKIKALLTKIGDMVDEMMVRPYSRQWVELKKRQRQRSLNDSF